MKATVMTKGFRNEVGSVILDLEVNERMNFSCIDIQNMNEVHRTLESMRNVMHRKIDAAINDAVANFMKNKYKNID